MRNRIIQVTILSSLFVLFLALPALSESWDYVYEADRHPLSSDAITDNDCVSVGPFEVLSYGKLNTFMNEDGTVTLDDTGEFGATNYFISLDNGLWTITEGATAELRLKVDDFNINDDGIQFLDVSNHHSRFGFKWWLSGDPNTGDVVISGNHTVGDPCAPSELLELPNPGWITIRLNVPANPLVRPIIWAWDENGVFGTNPDNGQLTCGGYAHQADTSRMTWGDLNSTETEGVVTYDYVRWALGNTYEPNVVLAEPNPCPCGRWGYLASDLTEDCDVNLADFARLATDWMNCTDPTNSNCVNLYDTSESATWEYIYECDDLPGVSGVIKDAATSTGVGQWTGTGAVTSPDGVVSVVAGLLEIDDIGVSGNHYCDATGAGLWTGPGSTVDIRMKAENRTTGNAYALEVSDGNNYHRWYVNEDYISNGPDAIAVDMTVMQTLRVEYPETGTPMLYVNYNGSLLSLPAYSGVYSTAAHLRFGDGWSDESGTFTYDYVRWTTQGAYGPDAVITLP